MERLVHLVVIIFVDQQQYLMNVVNVVEIIVLVVDVQIQKHLIMIQLHY